MIGKNTLKFNQSTMREVVQHYMDTILFKSAKKTKVISVALDRTDHGRDAFQVKIESLPEMKPPKEDKS